MKIKFIGAIERVTGSCSLMEQPDADRRFLVDCGMAQGDPKAAAFNAAPWTFVAARVDFVLLTHAHLDHCGLLPRLVREGFSGQIYCTRFTAELARLNLLSAAALPGAPFTRMDVERLQFEYVDQRSDFAFDKPIQIAKDLCVAFRPSAHIGGACTITVSWRTGNGSWKEMVFSGDVGPNTELRAAQPLLAGRSPLPGSPSYVLVESTYGGRLRDEHLLDAGMRLGEWARIIRTAMDSPASTIVVPCFSIHRCQELLFDLHVTLEHHLRDEIVSVRPLIEEEDHRKRALASGIAASRVERPINVMHEWTESRRLDFARIFARCDKTNDDGKVRSVFRPIADDESTMDEALELIRQMRVFTPKRRIQVIVDSPLAQKVTAVYRRELKRRLSGAPDSPMYRNAAMLALLGVDTEHDVDALTDKIFLGELQSESAFTAYILKFCKPEESEEVMKQGDLNIVLSSSGMCDVGPIVPHLAREILRNSGTIVLTGYADPQTLGGKLRAASRSPQGEGTEPLQVGEATISATDIRSKIEDLGGFYSGHTDSNGLLDFIFHRASNSGLTQPKCRLFINHGDNSKREALAELIMERAAKGIEGDCLIEGIEMPVQASTWFDLDLGIWIPDDPVSQQDEMQSLLLRIFLEQRRTNDLLAEMLRLQRPQKPMIKAK